VNHHFQSEIDGHSRRYTLRVTANVTAGAVLASALAGSGGGGGGGSPLAAAWSEAYAELAPGNHPNHGHTRALPGVWSEEEEAEGRAWVRGEATRLRLAAAAAAVSEAEAAAQGSDGRGGGGVDGSSSSAAAAAAAAAAPAAKPSPSPTPAPLLVLSQRLELTAGAVLPGVTSIILTRDTDGALIPYDSVHGITLITGLRLGLLAPLRTRAYHQFVSLPLYQDMAPWNIVFLGGRLDYIDYDTREKTYDLLVPKAYEVMEVLFNYKRTVEDFKKCGGKAGNPYNFPFGALVGGIGGKARALVVKVARFGPCACIPAPTLTLFSHFYPHACHPFHRPPFPLPHSL
jgi:hypothetical protein